MAFDLFIRLLLKWDISVMDPTNILGLSIRQDFQVDTKSRYTIGEEVTVEGRTYCLISGSTLDEGVPIPERTTPFYVEADKLRKLELPHIIFSDNLLGPSRVEISKIEGESDNVVKIEEIQLQPNAALMADGITLIAQKNLQIEGVSPQVLNGSTEIGECEVDTKSSDAAILDAMLDSCLSGDPSDLKKYLIAIGNFEDGTIEELNYIWTIEYIIQKSLSDKERSLLNKVLDLNADKICKVLPKIKVELFKLLDAEFFDVFITSSTSTMGSDNFFYQDLDKDKIEVLTKIFSLCNPSTKDAKEFIENCLVCGQYDLFRSIVLSKSTTSISQDIEDVVVNVIVQDQDLEMAKMFSNFILEFPESSREKVKTDLIKRCVDDNLMHMILPIIDLYSPEHLKELEIKEVRDAYAQRAYNHGNLSFIHSVFDKEWLSKSTEFFSEMLRSSVLLAPAIRVIFMKFFLNSKSNDVREFLLHLKENPIVFPVKPLLIEKFLKFMDGPGKLIARFPSKQAQNRMVELYGRGESYIEQQTLFANTHYDKVSSFLGKLRENPKISFREAYQGLSNVNKWRSLPSLTPLKARYSIFRPMAVKQLQAVESSPPLRTNQDKSIPSSLLRSASADKVEGPVTTICHKPVYGLSFYHGEFGEDLLGIDEDWSELVETKFDPTDPVALEDFRRKIATFYWKGCNLMLTPRGNSQTMLELFNILYSLHGLSPPTPSSTSVLPDCVALCCDLPTFVNQEFFRCWD